jgi:hypothetical protein
VCEKLHENMELEKNGEILVDRHATKDHYGCPRPYTFTDSGQILRKENMNDLNWKDSAYSFSYEMAFIEQKIFFEKYYYQKNVTRFSKKSLKDEAFAFYNREFRQDINKYDL